MKKSNKKPNIQKQILKTLAERPAVSLDSLKEEKNKKERYAISRSVKNLIDSDCVKIHCSDNQKYLKITQKGKAKLNNILLEGSEALVSNKWDGMWRILILDIPEKKKNERDALRYLLKKANFVCVKNTVWVSPYPYEHLFINIKKDLGLTNELMVIVTDQIDEETYASFVKAISEN
jgi:DNA-binding transcriptional regulator PaaX